MRARLPLVLAVTVACGARPSTPVPPAEGDSTSPLRLRGEVLVRDTSLVFSACGSTTERPVRAPPASQLRVALAAVNGAVRDSAYVEFMADTAGGEVLVRETLFAMSAVEGSRCDRARSSFSVEAVGTEPFWHLTLDSTQLLLERPEGPLELAFVASPPETRGALTTIIARRNEGRARELRLGLLRESCRDGMSDSWYPYRAEVRFGSTAVHGCAWR